MPHQDAKHLNALIVEDSDDDFELILCELRRGGYDVAWERVQSRTEFSEALDRRPWDVILADWSLPAFSGPAALSLVKEQGIDVPFILASGKIGEEEAVAAMKAGAHDFIAKGNLSRLVPAIGREMGEAESRAARRRAEEATRESEERFRRLFEEAPIAYHETDRFGTICRVNRAECELFGVRAEEILGKHVWDLDTPESRVAARKDTLWKIAGEQPLVPYEMGYARRDGSSVSVEVHENLVLDTKGEVGGLRCALLDVTVRKRAAEKIQRQYQNLSALHEIEIAVAASSDLGFILKVAVDHLVTHLHSDAADVYLYDPELRSLKYAAGKGFFSDLPDRRQIPLGEGCVGRAALDRRLLHLDRPPERCCDFDRDIFGTEKIQSFYTLPLVARGELRGVLEVFQRSAFALNADRIQFLESLAARIAVAINHAQLVTELRRSNEELHRAYEESLQSWVRALDMRSEESEGHTRRVTEMTTRLARAMGLFGQTLKHIRRGALLHDIGKIAVPDAILLKKQTLTPEERIILRRYPVRAYEILYPVEYLRPALDIPYCQHERWDGSGYPRGLNGTEIPLAARIFSVVNVWDVLCSPKPRGAGWPEVQVHAYLREQAGSAFDPAVVTEFLKLLTTDDCRILFPETAGADSFDSLLQCHPALG